MCRGTQVVTLGGQAIVRRTVDTAAGTDVTTLPDVLTVAKAAVAKIPAS